MCLNPLPSCTSFGVHFISLLSNSSVSFAKLSTEDGDSDASNPFEEETTLAEVPQVYLADLTTLTVKYVLFMAT